MSHQTATIEDTVYFWFAANDTSGSGGDGATPLYDVREAGALSSAIPLLSGTPTLLSHANYPAGCHEIAVAATAANGFAADDTFAVFCTIAIDAQNPSGYVGSCTLTPLAKASVLTTVASDLVLIYSDTTIIASDVVVLTGGVSDVESSLVIVKSDLVVITSDTTAIESELILVHSETTIIASDAIVLTTSVASLSTKQDSDMVVVAAAHTKTQSDIVIIDDFLDTEMAAQTSNLVIIASDTTAIEVDTGTTLSAQITTIASDIVIAASDIVLIQALLDDARAEPGQGAPPVNPDVVTKIDYLYKAWRNKVEQTATTMSVYNDAGTVVDQKATVSDDATTATKGEIVTGP